MGGMPEPPKPLDPATELRSAPSARLAPSAPSARLARATQHELAGRRRSTVVAVRLGTALRDAREAASLGQREIARRAGISQVHVSRLERCLGAPSSLATWARVAAAIGEDLVAYLEHAPGADRPRDIEHLKRQSAMVLFATPGGWRSLPEFAVDPRSPRSRSIDIVLIRERTREAVVTEIWDWFADVGAGFRSLDGKRVALADLLDRRPNAGRQPWNVRSHYIVRNTRRNHALVRELGPLFAARFPGSSRHWIRALTQPDIALPAGDGLLWSDRTGAILQGSRLRVPGNEHR